MFSRRKSKDSGQSQATPEEKKERRNSFKGFFSSSDKKKQSQQPSIAINEDLIKHLSPLCKAVYQNDFEKFKEIKKKDLLQADKITGRNVFHWIASGGRTNYLKYLFDQRQFLVSQIQAGIDALDIEGRSPICLAVINKHLDVLRMILNESTLSINVSDKMGKQPLYYSVINDDIAILTILILRGANINAKNENGIPLLIEAIHGHEEAAVSLINNNADVNVRDSRGSALHHAVDVMSPTLVKTLLTKGAVIEEINGVSPLDIASGRQNDNLELDDAKNPAAVIINLLRRSMEKRESTVAYEVKQVGVVEEVMSVSKPSSINSNKSGKSRKSITKSNRSLLDDGASEASIDMNNITEEQWLEMGLPKEEYDQMLNGMGLNTSQQSLPRSFKSSTKSLRSTGGKSSQNSNLEPTEEMQKEYLNLKKVSQSVLGLPPVSRIDLMVSPPSTNNLLSSQSGSQGSQNLSPPVSPSTKTVPRLQTDEMTVINPLSLSRRPSSAGGPDVKRPSVPNVGLEIQRETSGRTTAELFRSGSNIEMVNTTSNKSSRDIFPPNANESTFEGLKAIYEKLTGNQNDEFDVSDILQRIEQLQERSRINEQNVHDMEIRMEAMEQDSDELMSKLEQTERVCEDISIKLRESNQLKAEAEEQVRTLEASQTKAENEVVRLQEQVNQLTQVIREKEIQIFDLQTDYNDEKEQLEQVINEHNRVLRELNDLKRNQERVQQQVVQPVQAVVQPQEDPRKDEEIAALKKQIYQLQSQIEIQNHSPLVQKVAIAVHQKEQNVKYSISQDTIEEEPYSSKEQLYSELSGELDVVRNKLNAEISLRKSKETQLEELIFSAEELKEELATTLAKLDDKSRQYDLVNEQIIELEAELSKLRSRSAEKPIDIVERKRLESELQLQRQLNTELTQQIQSMNVTKNDDFTQLLMKQLTTSNELRNKMMHENAELLSQLEIIDNTLNELDNYQKQVLNENGKYKDQLEVTSARLNETLSVHQNIKAALEKIEREFQQKSNQAMLLEKELQEARNRHKSDVNDLNGKIKLFSLEIEQKQGKINSLHGQLEQAAKDAANKLSQAQAKWNEDKAKYDKLVVDLNYQIEELKEDSSAKVSKLEVEKRELTGKCHEQEKAGKAKDEQLKQLSSALDKNKQDVMQIKEKYAAALKKFEAEITQANSGKKDLQDKLKETEQDKETLSRDLQQAKTELDILRLKQKQQSQIMEESIKPHEDYSSLDADQLLNKIQLNEPPLDLTSRFISHEQQKLMKIASLLRNAIQAGSQSNRMELIQLKAETGQQLKIYELETKQLNEKMSELKESVSEYKRKLKDLEEKNHVEKEGFEARKTAWQNEKHHLEKQLDTASRDYELLKASQHRLEEDYHALQKSYKELASSRPDQPAPFFVATEDKPSGGNKLVYSILNKLESIQDMRLEMEFARQKIDYTIREEFNKQLVELIQENEFLRMKIKTLVAQNKPQSKPPNATNTRKSLQMKLAEIKTLANLDQ